MPRTPVKTCKFHPCFVHFSENNTFTVHCRAGVNRALMCFRVVIYADIVVRAIDFTLYTTILS